MGLSFYLSTKGEKINFSAIHPLAKTKGFLAEFLQF